MTTAPVPKEFVWGLLALMALVAVVPQMLTRMASGDSYFDTRDGEAAWVHRGLRFAAIGAMILLALALYFYPTT